MSLTAKSTGQDFDPVPEDIHRGICYGVVDVGTQYNTIYDNYQRKVIIIFELPGQRIEVNGEDKPRAISNEYTLSLGEKSNLRSHLESWRGKKFTDEELEGWDLEVLLGFQANLQVMHNKKGDKTYANIENIIKYTGENAKKTVKPENPTLFFSFENGNTELPENMPEWIQNKVKSSVEWKDMVSVEDLKKELDLQPVKEKSTMQEDEDGPTF